MNIWRDKQMDTIINRQANCEIGQRGGNKHTWKDIVTDRQGGGNEHIEIDRWKDIVTETY